MSKSLNTPDEITTARERLRTDYLPSCGQRVHTLTTWTPGRSSTAYVRLFVADQPGEITEITYLVGRALNERVHYNVSTRGLQRAGSGYNRALDVVHALSRALDVEIDFSEL